MPIDGLREHKKRETRIALSQAAVRLGVERGWDAVTVDDIAVAVGVSPRTFHNYFPSKAAAVAHSHRERTLATAEALRARPADEPLWDALLAAAQSRFPPAGSAMETVLDSARWLAGVRPVFADPGVRGEILLAEAEAGEELARAIAERLDADLDSDPRPRLLAGVVGATVAATVGHWLQQEPYRPVAPLLAEAFALVRAGLPEPGKESSTGL